MNHDNRRNSLPWWTWVLPFFVFFAGTQVSEYFRILPSVSLFYLPVPLGIVFIFWWGPRVLVGFFVNSIVSALYWGFSSVESILLLAAHQAFTIFLSWALCRLRRVDVAGLHNTNHLVSFVLLGLALPITFNSSYAFVFGRHAGSLLTDTVIIWFVDFFTAFVVTVSVLVFLSPFMSRRGWLLNYENTKVQVLPKVVFDRKALFEMAIITLLFMVFSQTLDFEKYWFVYGAGSIIAGVRLGFNAIVFVNAMVYVITYLLPFFNLVNSHVSTDDMRLVNLHIGMSMLSVSATVIGRVISDLRRAREEQVHANQQLKTMNQELDSFVYSVSHDLSSPLKSVQGLINVMRLEKDATKVPGYVDMIEKSVSKLDHFIKDVLDYSRSNRKEVIKEPVDLTALVDEILDNHRYMDTFKNIDFRLNFDLPIVKSDRLLLKTILSNLISNAIKYQKINGDGSAWVEISSVQNSKKVEIKIADNGEGIPDTMLPRIFEMFYKGSQVARGSGLGLYIAKAASEKIDAVLKVESKFGEGSTFYLLVDQ